MSSGAMPKAYKYENLPNAVKSSQKTVRFQSVNGNTFAPSSVIRMEIKSSDYLIGGESFLKFTVANNSTDQAIFFDNLSSSIFNRVRITANGITLSDIQQYGQLANFLVLSSTSDSFQRMGQITSAMDASGGVALNAGTGINTIAAVAGGVTSTVTVTAPLISGFLNSSQYIPLGLMAGPLVIELWLETFTNTFIAGGAPTIPTFTVSNVEMICKTVHIEDAAADAMIKSIWQTQGLKIKTDDYFCHINAIAAGQQNGSLIIPERSASLKSLFTLFCHGVPTFAVSAMQSFGFSVNSYYYKIGPSLYPSQAVAVSLVAPNYNYVEAFSELQKCWHSGGMQNINAHTYSRQSIFGNNLTYGNLGNFAMCYDFESYPDSGGLFSGVDTATLALPISLFYTTSAVTPVAINAYSYAHRDVVYEFQAGTGLVIKHE